MDLDAYRNTKGVHRNGSNQKLALFVHTAIGHVNIPIGWRAAGEAETVAKMTHIRHELLEATDPVLLKRIPEQLAKIEAFLNSGWTIDGIAPSDQEVQRLLSFAYHILNPNDPRGAADREILGKAVQVLDIGGILPDHSKPSRGNPADAGPNSPSR